MPHATPTHPDATPYRSTPGNWTLGGAWLVAWTGANAILFLAWLVAP